MSSIKLFSVKDKVFVKRRAYPAWPALIIGIKANTESELIYTVYFYGTGNYGECKADALCLYEENKYKLGKPRRKQKKLKKLAEALEEIENDFIPDNNVKVFMPPISTTKINQELSLEDESKNVNKIENPSEYNLKTEENTEKMSIYEPINESSLSKGIKVGLRKTVSNSTDLKRKLSDDVPHVKVQKMLKKSKSFKPIDIQPIVLLEPLKDVYLQRKLKGNQVSSLTFIIKMD